MLPFEPLGLASAFFTSPWATHSQHFCFSTWPLQGPQQQCPLELHQLTATLPSTRSRSTLLGRKSYISHLPLHTQGHLPLKSRKFILCSALIVSRGTSLITLYWASCHKDSSPSTSLQRRPSFQYQNLWTIDLKHINHHGHLRTLCGRQHSTTTGPRAFRFKFKWVLEIKTSIPRLG